MNGAIYGRRNRTTSRRSDVGVDECDDDGDGEVFHRPSTTSS